MTLTLSPDQRAAVDTVLTSRLAILTGGPGTGKTTVAKTILEEVTEADQLRPHEIALCAPTGKAARRLSEQTARSASTIHRLLGFDPRGGFEYNADCQLPFRFVLIDEASMVDVELGADLLEAIPDGCRVLFVGDADQLPSVGPGNVLRDLIASGAVPVARLTTLHRQDERSWIARIARAVLEGKLPTCPADAIDFFWHEAEEADDAAGIIEQLCRENPALQVLAPQKKSAVGVEALNERLQQAINPRGADAEAWKLGDGSLVRERDRVIQIKNDYALGVMNGEIGDVVGFADVRDEWSNKTYRVMRVDLGDRIVDFQRAQCSGLRLAYAVTIHKSQGSEYDGIVVPVHSCNSHMLSRSLLYTAITRGKRVVHLVGNRSGLKRAVRKANDAKRYTGLAEALAQ